MTVNVLDYSAALGFEQIGKEGMALLRDHLNPMIDSMKTAYDAKDTKLGLRLTKIEHVNRRNFYYGHRPSLVEAPVDKYPNCSVMAYAGSPAPENESQDVLNVMSVTMYVELMCKSIDNEEEVNTRIQRTADAAHGVLLQAQVLGGAMVEAGRAPNVIFTDLFVRPEVKGHGARFLWQGARLEYTLSKYVTP